MSNTINTVKLTLTEAQARAFLFCLDMGDMDLAQMDQEEKTGSGLGHFERSIEAMRQKLATQGFSI